MEVLPPPSSRLHSQLKAAVQSVGWTYSLYWHLCPQEGILKWTDGYYNGAIKTRKTVQPMEVSEEEASLQRSQQLRELYQSLSAGETNQPTKRPCAALSPEDLTESEWFYLMCESFSFPPGVGLPGKAYARRQHVWLTGANEVDSITFSRAILAKSARIQTVVCIPLLEGTVEFGSMKKIQEDLGFIQHVKSFFSDIHMQQYSQQPKPAMSEHSTSNPIFHSPPIPIIYAVDPPGNVDEDEDENEEEEEEEEEDPESDSMEVGRTRSEHEVGVGVEPSELMQLDMSEDIRLGSPEDGSNNLDSDFHFLAVSGRQEKDESDTRWQILHQPLNDGCLQPPDLEFTTEELTQDDTHYSETVTTILQSQSMMRWAESASATAYVNLQTQSAFAKWTECFDSYAHNTHQRVESTCPSPSHSQSLLKYILFTVPYLHAKDQKSNTIEHHHAPLESTDPSSTRLRKSTNGSQEDLSANHVLAERRRREKLNERFIILRSLVPFVTKMDKASILGDTIEYVKQLRKKIQDLEGQNRKSENEQRSSSSGSIRVPGSENKSRKMRIVEGRCGGAKSKNVVVDEDEDEDEDEEEDDEGSRAATSVEVSIIESDALLEIQCGYREGLLLDIMQVLKEMRIETTTVQSSISKGVFESEIRAKVKDNSNKKKQRIAEVKRAINLIISI